MAKTDKTDTTARSTYWSVTAYKNEIAICRDATRFPVFVESVNGQTETCPTTGTIHFQGIIKCSRQVRFSCFKSWLPTAHIEPAKNVPRLKTYVKKSETSNGDYAEVSNEMPMYAPEEVLRMLGDKSSEVTDLDRFIVNNKFNVNAHYWHLVDLIVEENGDRYVRLFMNPIIKTMFTNMSVWKRKGPLVLQAPPDEDSESE